jgi:hypothetical protein
MGKKGRINPIIVAGGVVVIVILFVLFTPAILGSASSSGNLEKYNGTSNQGNDTARIANSIDNFFVGLTGIPLTLAAFVAALFVVVIAIIWVLKRNR